MTRVEVYYYDKKIKTFKDVSDKSIEGMVDFIIHAVNTLVGPNGVIVVKDRLIESTEKLKELLTKAINKGENVKVEIKTTIPFEEEIRRDIEVNVPRQIETMKIFFV